MKRRRFEPLVCCAGTDGDRCETKVDASRGPRGPRCTSCTKRHRRREEREGRRS